MINAMGKSALGILILTVFVSGCATVPQEISRAPDPDVPLREVQADAQRYIDAAVRWGGTIVGVENDAEESALEIIARDLRRDGRPAEDERSPGRFVAVIDGFLDPAIFVEGRDITIFGRVEGETVGRIGGREYTYPVVRIQDYQLWRRADTARDVRYGYPVYFYDPFYPWGPYYHPGSRFGPGHAAPAPRRPSVLRR